VETQYHMIQDGKRLLDEPVERLIGRATVIEVTQPEIKKNDLIPFESSIARNPFVLLCTGYADRVRAIDPSDPARPVVRHSALEWPCDRGMKLLGIDAFDFDSGPPYPGHHLVFQRWCPRGRRARERAGRNRNGADAPRAAPQSRGHRRRTVPSIGTH
jgi:kynurenine formamidase